MSTGWSTVPLGEAGRALGHAHLAGHMDGLFLAPEEQVWGLHLPARCAHHSESALSPLPQAMVCQRLLRGAQALGNPERLLLVSTSEPRKHRGEGGAWLAPVP